MTALLLVLVVQTHVKRNGSDKLIFSVTALKINFNLQISL
ncbi:hypothetical protein SAMN05428971_0356 [Candidatus Pantoea varia]|uniref:Uncharacterized protein n=1 Tax=Candidatus Pantoea varia TaxID=1881036 RepID=A0A1I4WW10_9GAMM|nr:hypothetical protein SAMN05428971_0356 [Pantoea varia]